MSTFFQRLQSDTQRERTALLANPLVNHALEGRLGREAYVAFLRQAYHHVRHTVPLLMAAGARLPVERSALRNALAEYVAEELGHEEWILEDIANCGYSPEEARASLPNAATEQMVAYAYYIIDRVNPLGFFGMVHVLEGTSVSIADRAARCIAAATDLPMTAFTYLTSHGSLDAEHVRFFEDLMNGIENPQEQDLIVHCARRFYRLYSDVFSAVAAEHTELPSESTLQVKAHEFC
ncbi:TenA family transcriptional regulator [Haliea sp. E17]|uniref:TenA family transcriptional regulator n=1 Tax=Haliea sp. E17 TaxID=3401576 RepID=UPI003AABF237